MKCDGTRAETRFRLSAKRTSPFKSAGALVQSTAGSRGVRISGSNAGYNLFGASVKSTGYPLYSPVSPSLSLPCVTVCHHISTGLYCTCCQCPAAPPLGHPASGYVTATFHCTMNSPYTLSFFRCCLSLPQTCLCKPHTKYVWAFLQKMRKEVESVSPPITVIATFINASV